MNILKSLIVKELLHIVRDGRTLLIVLVMPIILLLIFGFAISMEVNDVKVVAAVEHHTDETRQILIRLEQNPYFSFVGMMAPQQLEEALLQGKADVALVLRYNSGTLKAQVITDASNTVMAQAAAGYLESVVTSGIASPPLILRTLYNPQLKSSYNFVPGILGMIFILICAIMTSVSIVSEKQSGTLYLLLVSPARPATVIAGKLIPYLLVSCVLLSMMLAISYTLLGIPWSGNIGNIIGISLLYIILALSIGLLISTLVSTQTAALIVSAMVFMIPVIMLSGMIFPIDNMPKVLKWFSCIVPARWYIAAMRKLMIEQLPLTQVALEVGILAAMTGSMLILAVARFTRSTK